MICYKNFLTLLLLVIGLFGCCYGGLHSNLEAARLYENCIAGKMSGSMLFNETEKMLIRKIVLETGMRMYQLNLDPRTPSNARTMLRLFIASLSNMVAQDETSKRTEKKQTVLSALDTCASVLSYSLVSELADEVMQILSFVENEKILTAASTMAEDKPNSSKVLKEYDFGPNALGLTKRSKRDLVYFSSVPMYQNAAPRSRPFASSPAESSIADTLLKSPSFVKTFNVGLSQQNAAYYSQGMVQSGLAGYPNSIVREAMNSVVTNVRSLGFIITPTDYAQAIASTITTALRGKKALSSANGKNIGRNMVSKLESMVQNSSSSSSRRQMPASQNAMKRIDSARASALPIQTSGSSASNVRSQMQSSSSQSSNKIAARVLSGSAIRNGQSFEQQTFGDYSSSVLGANIQSTFGDASLPKPGSQSSAPNRAFAQSSNPLYSYDSVFANSPSTNKKTSSIEPANKDESSYSFNTPDDSGMGSEYESYSFDDTSMGSSENSLRNPSYSYEETSMESSQTSSRNPSYSYEDRPLSNKPTSSRNPSYFFDDVSSSRQSTNSRNPSMPKTANELPGSPFGDNLPQYEDYQQSDSSYFDVYQTENDTPTSQPKQTSRNPSKSQSPSEYIQEDSYSYDFPVDSASNGQGVENWSSYYSMLSDQDQYPMGDYGLDSVDSLPTDERSNGNPEEYPTRLEGKPTKGINGDVGVLSRLLETSPDLPKVSVDEKSDLTSTEVESSSPEIGESSTSLGPGTETSDVVDTEIGVSTSAVTGVRSGPESSVVDASKPADSASAVTSEEPKTKLSLGAASDSGLSAATDTRVESENEGSTATTDTDTSATTATDIEAPTESPIADSVVSSTEVTDAGAETEKSARTTTDSGESPTPETGVEEKTEPGPVGVSGDLPETTAAVPTTKPLEDRPTENPTPDTTPAVVSEAIPTETPAPEAASTDLPQTGKQPGEEKPAESAKNESAADLTVDFSDVEKILSITSPSLANIKSKDSSNIELCQKLSELGPIVNMPPIKNCSDKDVIEYLLRVLSNIAMRKCID